MSTYIAAKVRDLPASDWKGTATLYKLTPPVTYQWDEQVAPAEYVVVSALPAAFDTGLPETYIFEATPDGKPISWAEMEGSFRGGMDHAAALRGLGYEVQQ